jgi:hypothetical protein
MNLLKYIVVAASPNKSYFPVGKPVAIKQIKAEQPVPLLNKQSKQNTRKARIYKQSN